ncbi:MAG: Holliday junction resolvase RecU [Firmicutes bacterium]|nr:Holliday junction resolvase RecU [Bacillota bacterium]
MLVNYPNGMKTLKHTNITHGNRGMSLESDINETNRYYLAHNIAVIYKKPTPITVVKVDFKSRIDAVIKEAYYKTPSTTDYNGVYQGKYIDFEAKETRNKSFFPLSNIHPHQIEHLKKITEHGGIGFLIIRFTNLNLTYFLDSSKLMAFLDNHTRKSIPVSYFETYGKRIETKYAPRLDYLKILEDVWKEGDPS